MKKHPVKIHAEPAQKDYQPKRDRSNIFSLITVISFFIGFGLCLGFYNFTLLDIIDLSKLLAFFAVIGFLIPLKLYRRWFHFIKYEVIFFNVMGIAPLFTGLFLTLNFIFASNPTTHKFKIEKIYFEGQEDFKSVGVVLENNYFSGERKIVELTDVNPSEIYEKSNFQVTISEGLFGFQVINEKLIIK